MPILLDDRGLIVAGSVSTGGLATLAVKMSRKKNSTSEIIASPDERSIPDVNEHN